MRTIMVVDDSMVVRSQATSALAPAGFKVVPAVDGVDALEKLGTSPEVSLVICDLNMPRMNGIQFLEAMEKGGHKVPVVMLTTEGKQELIARAKQLGARGWIIKPFKNEMLVAAAEKLA